MSALQLLTTPLPFPVLLLNIAGTGQQGGMLQRNWYVIVIVVHLIFFALFVGLLVYYIWFVKTPGKWLTEERIGEDGLSESESSFDSESDSSSSSGSDCSSEDASEESTPVNSDDDDDDEDEGRGNRH